MDIKSKKNKVFISFVISLLLCITLIFTFVSGAFFKTSKTATGTLSFGSGIRANVTNLSATSQNISDKSATLNLLVTNYNGTSYESEVPAYKELTTTNFSGVSQNEYMVIANPTITPAEKTVSYYLRAKWLVKVESGVIDGVMQYTEVSLENLAIEANITSLPVFLSSSWFLNTDGYYYNIADGASSLNSTDNLNVNSYNEEPEAIQKSVTFFDSTANENTGDRVIFVDDGFNLEITGLSIELVIEVVEANASFANSTWGINLPIA